MEVVRPRRRLVACCSLALLLFFTFFALQTRLAVVCVPSRPPAASAADDGRHACDMDGYGWTLPPFRGTLYGSVWSSESRWGNELSRYWQARAMARLGGLAFASVGDKSRAWLRFLPAHVAADAGRQPGGSCAAFASACAACGSWKYAHGCLGAWTALLPEIARDTRAALAHHARRTRRPLPAFGPADVVVHSRCSRDTWFWHGDYGPAAFSLYDRLPGLWAAESDAGQPNGSGGGAGAGAGATIFLVGAGRQERGPRAHAAYTGPGLFPPCAAKLDAVEAHLRGRYPGARVVRGAGWDAFEDFAHMALAPTLVKDASSFSLWAGLANTGTVVSTPLALTPRAAQGEGGEGGEGGAPGAATPGPQPPPRRGTFDAPNWAWSAAPVLYPDVAAREGLNTSDTGAVIAWLRAH